MVLGCVLVHRREFAVVDFSLKDAVRRDFRGAGEEYFEYRMGRVKVVDQVGLIEEDADFAFDYGVRFLESIERLLVDDFVPKFGRINVFKLVLELVV